MNEMNYIITSNYFMILIICLLSTVHSTYPPAEEDSSKGPGISACSWWGLLPSTCNESVPVEKAPKECTSFLYEGVTMDLEQNIMDSVDKTSGTEQDIHRWLRLQPVDDRKSYHSVSSSDATTSRCEVDGHELAEALQNVEELQFPLEIRSSKSFGSGYWTPPIATPGACRICWQPDSDDENKCITPCHCCGSISKVHRSCLEKWLRQSGTSQCEICLYQYTIKRVKKYSLLESIKAWWNSSEKQEEVEELCTDVRVFCLSFPFMCGLTYAGSVVTDHILRLDAQGYLVALYQMSSFGIFSAILTADFFYGFWAAWQGTHHFTNWLDFNRDSLLVTVVDDKSAE